MTSTHTKEVAPHPEVGGLIPDPRSWSPKYFAVSLLRPLAQGLG